MEALNNRCSTCGAPITFNPTNQMWDCKYCGSKFTIEEMEKHDTAASKEANQVTQDGKKKLEEMDVYHCESCGAEVMADETTTATFCVYCGNTAILKSRITDGVAPTKIIPFKKVEEDAINAFQRLSKGRPLMPKLFNDPDNIEKISGVYIPFWTYDLDVAGKITFNATDTTRWSDHNYRYEKIDKYQSKKDGSMSFKRILTDGSSHFDDDLMDSLEPFHFEELKDYNHAYLSGFLAEKYDVDSNKAMERASQRAMNTAVSVIEDSVKHQTKTIEENNLVVKKVADDYILLPVWMVNIKYRDKIYTFAMNGQTGEIVGNIPLDIKKTVIFSILIFLASFLLMFLFTV